MKIRAKKRRKYSVCNKKTRKSLPTHKPAKDFLSELLSPCW